MYPPPEAFVIVITMSVALSITLKKLNYFTKN
jgi:hypothetical protein